MTRSAPLALLLALGALPALAAGPQPSPERGLALAERWCARCHLVAPGLPGGDVGPPFMTVAGAEAATDEALAAWLAAPHDPMPDLDLAPAHIADIIAHIRSLKAPE